MGGGGAGYPGEVCYGGIRPGSKRSEGFGPVTLLMLSGVDTIFSKKGWILYNVLYKDPPNT